jgi:hypothetical protein
VRIRTPNDGKWGNPARVVKEFGPPEARSYVVNTGEGEYRRNRRHLQKIPPREVKQHSETLVPLDEQAETTTQDQVETQPAAERPSRPIRSTRGRIPERLKDYVLQKP